MTILTKSMLAFTSRLLLLVDTAHAVEVDTNSWTQVAGKDAYAFTPVSDKTFRSLIWADCMDDGSQSRPCIVRRICDSCTSQHHRDIYYKRITPMSAGFNFLDRFLNHWFESPDNALNTDFELYSSYEDALAGINRWLFCNYNDHGVGFPRDCNSGTSPVGGQWNSYSVRADGVSNFGFYVENSVPTFSSKVNILNATKTFNLTFDNPTASSSIFAAIVAVSKCDTDNSKDQVDANTFNVVSGETGATVQQLLIDKEMDTEGNQTIHMCIRSDIYASSNPNASITTKKMSLSLTVNFESTGACTIKSISTSEFEASSTSSGVNVKLTGHLGW